MNDTLRDPAVALYKEWQALRGHFDGLPHGIDYDARRACLGHERVLLVRQLAEARAETLDGVAGKLHVVRGEIESGAASDGRDKRLLESAIADLDRLARTA